MPPVRILLSSPRQAIVVKENVARLQPLGGGRFGGQFELELLARGGWSSISTWPARRSGSRTRCCCRASGS